MVSSKLDAIGAEYNALLAGQLDAQRHWFEDRHTRARCPAGSTCSVNFIVCACCCLRRK